MDNEILRHSEPSLLDESPHGTRCKVPKGKEFDLYVQISKDDTKPNWNFVGSFPENCPPMIIEDLVNHLLGRI